LPDADLIADIGLDELTEKLEYPSVAALEHAMHREDVRKYRRQRDNPEKYGIPNKPTASFVHGDGCEFSDGEDSSSGNESDTELDVGLIRKVAAVSNIKLFESSPPVVAISPEPFPFPPMTDADREMERMLQDPISSISFRPDIGQWDDDDNAVSGDSDAPDSGSMTTEMVGLADTSEHLSTEQSAAKMKLLASYFWTGAGMYPTFAIASGKFISCSFPPAVAKDQSDAYGLKMFYLHQATRVTSFSEPSSGAIPLSTAAMRDLVAGFDTFVSHANSKASLVTVTDSSGKNRHTAANPISDMKLGDRVKCPASGNFGQVWVRFVHAQNGDPLCVVDFVHQRAACTRDGKRPIHHTNFVVQVQTVFHLVKNVFPLMREFQKLLHDKAEELLQRFDAKAPDAVGGRVVVNDFTTNPNVSWEFGRVPKKSEEE
jgi:hypothetical protein